METQLASQSRKPILIWLIASQTLALLSLVFWLVIAGLSVMAFAIAAWIAYAHKKDRLAGILTTLTFLPVLMLILILALSSFFYSIGI